MSRTELRRDDPRYPAGLAAREDAPETLFCIGDVSALDNGALGVIGSRKATPYGLSAARMLAGWAAERGWTIVSGAAIGCDQAAHAAALAATHGGTIAVLGCGADVDYPAGARELLGILRSKHLVISERPWGAPPVRWAFPRRNRMIAALSDHLLVVEAALPSGTFGTVDFALECGTDVLAVPGSIFSPESRGTNRLVRNGAIPITDVSDLAIALGHSGLPQQLPLGAQTTDELLCALRANPMRPDDIVVALKLDIIEVAVRLAALESAREVARYPDGRYGPCRL